MFVTVYEIAVVSVDVVCIPCCCLRGSCTGLFVKVAVVCAVVVVSADAC